MKVFLSTADASGDLLASALVEALRERVPELEVFGLGGDTLVAAGLEPVVPQSELAIAGLAEVLSQVPRLLQAYTKLRSVLRDRRPELAILVDSPDLNLRFAAVARRLGVPVFYLVAPQFWAWRPGRLKQLRRRVAHLGAIFPFEVPLLEAAGVRASFVGHPLVDRIAEFRAGFDRAAVAAELGLDLERPVLGLLPGSRRNELAGNLDLMLDTAALLRDAIPELQVQLPLAPTLLDSAPSLPDSVKLVRGRTYDAMALSTCLLAAPGTVTVEAALLGVPLVVTHRMSRLSFEVFRRIARVASSCQANLIAGEGVVPERLQEQARPGALLALLLGLLRDPAAREKQRSDLARVAAELGPPGAAARAADLALEVAGRPPHTQPVG